MITLALDSTTRAGSVALLDGDRIVEERAGDSSRTHAERLPGELTDVLRAHALTPASVDLFAVASGPGSFTGLRIGIATMQGLALASGRSLVGVSSLDALAEAGHAEVRPGQRLAVWMDAHRGEVFSALYRVDAGQGSGTGDLIEIDGPGVGNPAEVLAQWLTLDTPPSLFIGDGAALYAGIIRSTMPSARVTAAPPVAAAVGRLARLRAARGDAGHPAALQPLYVRRPDAEVAREQKPQR